MKLSNFDQANEYVVRLKALKEARDMAQYDGIRIVLSNAENEMSIPSLTSIHDCRVAIAGLLDTHIAECKRHLATYGIEVDE